MSMSMGIDRLAYLTSFAATKGSKFERKIQRSKLSYFGWIVLSLLFFALLLFSIISLFSFSFDLFIDLIFKFLIFNFNS